MRLLLSPAAVCCTALAALAQMRPPVVHEERAPEVVEERALPVVVAGAPDYAPDLPRQAVKYTPARHTQRIAVTNNQDTIDPVLTLTLPDVRWHQSGGMAGVRGWRSEKYKSLPDGWVEGVGVYNIYVRNSFGHFQPNRGLVRAYPVGTRFDDVLVNAATGRVFEHRVREKTKLTPPVWDSQVVYKDESQFPAGYKGLGVSCASCHNEAGTGGYAVGLAPGGDTVFSDPLPWHLTRWGKIDP